MVVSEAYFLDQAGLSYQLEVMWPPPQDKLTILRPGVRWFHLSAIAYREGLAKAVVKAPSRLCFFPSKIIELTPKLDQNRSLRSDLILADNVGGSRD